eukprot:GHVL01023335.1.p1 GENE.GHVL01023335.1~~GHVL01023335.1.p1  ORF type:complete len:148 (-),score=19.52 GHVL01023335.1:48-491(-)
MYAILRACHYVNDLPRPPTRVVILSDSKSALTALQNGSRNREELQTEILFLCHQIIASGTELTLMYIPSHTGIRGNDMADRAAKEAVTDQAAFHDLKSTKTEAKHKMAKVAWRHWETELKIEGNAHGWLILPRQTKQNRPSLPTSLL